LLKGDIGGISAKMLKVFQKLDRILNKDESSHL